jgi:hypothetical protein
LENPLSVAWSDGYALPPFRRPTGLPSRPRFSPNNFSGAPANPRDQ